MNLGSNSVYPVKLRKYSDKASISTPGEYLEIPLSDDIEEIGLTKGDDLQMTLRKSGFESIRYLKISGNDLQDRGRVHSLSLKRNEDSSPSYAVSIPVEYSVHSDLSPFQGLEQDDTVMVEVNSSSELIRVYQPSDYQNRLEELVESESTPDIRVPAVLAGLYQGKSLQQSISEVGECKIKPYHQLNGGYIEDPVYVEVFDEEDRLIEVLSGKSEYVISLPAGIYYLELQVPGYRFKRSEIEVVPDFTRSPMIRLYTK
jgi:hypothetical protein